MRIKRPWITGVPSVFCLMLALASTLGAQQKSSGSGCVMPDTTAEWFRNQRAWFDDSKGGWSDDAFRKELLHSAGLDAMPTDPIYWGFDISSSNRVAAVDTVAIGHLRALSRRRDS